MNEHKKAVGLLAVIGFAIGSMFFTPIGGIFIALSILKNADKIEIRDSCGTKTPKDNYTRIPQNVGSLKTQTQPVLKPIESSPFDIKISRESAIGQIKDGRDLLTQQHPGYGVKKELRTREDYYQNAKNFTPEELLELDKTWHNEFSHDIYHESNKTVHYTNGIFLAHNATRKEYYFGKSGDTISLVCQKLTKGKNPLRDAFNRGDSLRIKILTADGRVFRSNGELEIDAKSRFSAKHI